MLPLQVFEMALAFVLEVKIGVLRKMTHNLGAVACLKSGRARHTHKIY